VMKHVRTNDKYLSCRPLAKHTVAAFKEAQIFVSKFTRENGEQREIILDSGCGTGRSTLLLGERYPNSIVLGIDRSTISTLVYQRKLRDQSGALYVA